MDDLFRRRDSRTPVLILSTLLVVVVLVATVLIGGLIAQNREEARRADTTQAQVRVEGKQVGALQRQVATLKKKAANPTVEIWNTCGGGPCQVGPQQVLLGGVPDTFVLHFSFTSTAPVRLSFLTFHQWTQFDNCGLDTSCVTSSYVTYAPATNQSVDFALGAGCAAYLYVLTASVPAMVRPNVSATYQPAATVTGQCAGSS
ncbi:MAG: hypothetical protein J2P44_11910 [Candidatus Dormibacteraeota bacterium]|nr:hypothetical protein [Candidatus Dormibacteraeota bacterium]MBO0709058.1 hypothetical protein [Candidatus Dormibacteraeota bacterium]